MKCEIEELRQWFKENIIAKDGRINARKLNKKYKFYNESVKNKQMIDAFFNIYDTDDVKELAWLLFNTDDFKPPVCKECGGEVRFKNYRDGYFNFCSTRCSSKNTDVRKKLKETSIKRYGTEIPQKSDIVKEKAKQTNIKRYGVSMSLQNKEVKTKAKKTILKRYGVEHQMQSDIVKNKAKETWKEKYGVEHFSHVNYKHYDEFTNMDKEYVLSKFSKDFSADTIDVLSMREYFNCSAIKIREKLSELGLYVVKNGYRSKEEDAIYKWVLNIAGDDTVIPNNRKVIYPYEIDVYVENKKVGIEYDGVYWHGEHTQVDLKKQYKKTTLAHDKGIRLFQIYDVEWKDKTKRAIWQSMIRNALNLTENKVYARKCTIKEIDTKTAREFIDNNHLQGYASANVKLGLFHNDELVSVATFSKLRFKDDEDELVRFCNKINTVVVGGFSKLIKHYVNAYKPYTLISYANRRWSNGSVYEKNGFEFVHVTQAGYFYTDGHGLYSRQRFQKHKLKELHERGVLDVYNDDMSEYEIMLANGFWRVYDAGHIKYRLV